MPLNSRELEQLCDLARQAALAAGRHIASVDRNTLAVEHKAAGCSLASQVVTEVDRHCDHLIKNYLQESCTKYNLALLSEESAEQQDQQVQNRFSQEYFWCVDPLDGTLPFTQGKAGYAVSIALVSQTGTPLLGVVYDPVHEQVISAVKGAGALINGKPIQITERFGGSGSTLAVYADNSFKLDERYAATQNSLRNIAADFAADGYSEIYGNGSVKNACALLTAPLACYFKFPKATAGGGSVWDFSASACIVKEAGGWVSNFAGAALDLNRKGSTFMNHQGVIYASDKRLAQAIMGLKVS
ncbi:3'(2'), 5'-bisphosphate nucleotidase [Alteromonadaceae bacterium Bs31]|nr:3'(2'), 5'-bisphosphate nucleotidase [Alteromonadaceae bacterium Bs31]